MKRKLYIPTSTLNFNNILSSESISPSAFYARRGYGFKRIEKVELNCFDNIILLYDKFPYFDIAESEIENYPMVVEINTASCNANFREVANGVYACDKTIYLNPFDTVFWFNNVSELVRTKVKSNPSIEVKLANFYNGCLAVVDDTISKYTYTLKNVVDGALNEDAIYADIRADKLKGILYGYLLACNNVCDKQVAVIKMHIRELINTLSSILSAPDFGPIMLKSKKLDALYSQLDASVGQIGGSTQTLEEIIELKLQEYNVPNLVEILKKEGLYELWHNTLSTKHKANLSRVVRFSLKEGEDKVSALEHYEKMLYSTLIIKQEPTKLITIDDLPKIESNKIGSIPGQKEFWVKLLNLYLDKNLQKDSFLNGRYDYAKEGVLLCRDGLKETGVNWDISEHRTYLNALLSNLKSFTPFEINNTNSLSFKSFAMFFQKANIEILELKDLMESKGTGDMRYVYSLWGAVFGFADMPKNLTSEFFDSQDEDYKVKLYKDIYKSLFNIDLKGKLPKCRYKMPKVEPIVEPIVKPISAVEVVVENKKSQDKSRLKRTRKTEKSMKVLNQIELNFEEVNVNVPMLEKPFVASEFLASLKSIVHFNEYQLNKLLNIWKITAQKYPERSIDQIEYFIKFSAKQGRTKERGNILYGIITKELAEDLREEIKEKLK